VIESPAGFHLVRLLDVRPASETSFGQVRESIAQQLRAQRRAAAWEKFVGDLEKATEFAIDEPALRELKL